MRGSLADLQLLTAEATRADVVIHTANADSYAAVEALLVGLASRIKNNVTPLYMHTSGAGLVMDNAAGEISTDKVYHDDDAAQIDGIPDHAPHREVDKMILAFGEKHGIDTVIVVPPTIWGLSPGPDLAHSHQIPWLIQRAIANKRAYHIGKGENVWSHINIIDLADLFCILIWRCVEMPGQLSGIYFAEGGEFQWKQVSAAIQCGLMEGGFSIESTPLDTPIERIEEVFGHHAQGMDARVVLGGNARIRANKARGLGWIPKRSTKDQLFSWIALEVNLLAREPIGNAH